jgi:hypothetical protein
MRRVTVVAYDRDPTPCDGGKVRATLCVVTNLELKCVRSDECVCGVATSFAVALLVPLPLPLLLLLLLRMLLCMILLLQLLLM